MFAILIIAVILIYLAMAGTTFGYVASKHTKVETYYRSGSFRDPHDFEEAAKEAEPWFGAIFWPITLLIFGISVPLSRLARISWAKGESAKERAKLRIKLEEKIRIAQEVAEKEAEQEIEELLAQNKRSRKL